MCFIEHIWREIAERELEDSLVFGGKFYGRSHFYYSVFAQIPKHHLNIMIWSHVGSDLAKLLVMTPKSVPFLVASPPFLAGFQEGSGNSMKTWTHHFHPFLEIYILDRRGRNFFSLFAYIMGNGQLPFSCFPYPSTSIWYTVGLPTYNNPMPQVHSYRGGM